jgi:hypothetical protein
MNWDAPSVASEATDNALRHTRTVRHANHGTMRLVTWHRRRPKGSNAGSAGAEILPACCNLGGFAGSVNPRSASVQISFAFADFLRVHFSSVHVPSKVPVHGLVEAAPVPRQQFWGWAISPPPKV